VLFSSAQDSDALLSRSAQSWPDCRQYTHLPATTPARVFTVGPIANVNGTLSAAVNVNGIFCQRVLTVANNVAIDVEACGAAQSDNAFNIAHQIAAKVPTT
jgi:hypothetical protein